ncbi:hypothetical protein [Pontiella agarivorans]|nr:hypothetical protein [Pontiella agarivorans]
MSGSPDEAEESASANTEETTNRPSKTNKTAARESSKPSYTAPPPIAALPPATVPAPATGTPGPTAASVKKTATDTPPKTSSKELRKRYHVEGIAQGSSGAMVMINQTPLKEGDTLDGLKIDKIGQNHIDVTFQGQSYHLRTEVF